MFVGGPVSTGSVLAVAELDDPDDASELLFGAVGFVQEPDVPVLRGRVFVGYAGWSAGQLESELEEESWLVLPAEPDDLFSDDPDGLWSAVLRRQGGPYALLSLMPPDPVAELSCRRMIGIRRSGSRSRKPLKGRFAADLDLL